MIQLTIASQQYRSGNLQVILNALNKQTVKPDKIVIILQGYQTNIDSDIDFDVVYYQRNEGAIARFWHLGSDINLVLDDDFIPNERYVQTALEGLQRHPNAICSFWGYRKLDNNKYVGGWENIESWVQLKEDVRCIRLGSGLSIWDEKVIGLKTLIHNHINYNDLQIAIFCAENNIPMYCISHPSDIATHLGDLNNQRNAIWKSEPNNMSILNDFNNSLLSIFEK